MPKDLIRRVLMRLDKNYLPYEYFDRLPNFEPTEILDGVTVEKLPTNEGVYLRGKFKKGTKIIEHYHNSKEFIYITKGKILIDNKTEVNEGGSYILKPFELHTIKSIEECEMYIQFIKDDPFKKFK